MDITFDVLVTPAGVVIAAGVITGLIQLLKASFPVIDDRISGASMAFVISAVLYVVIGLALGSEGSLNGANGALNVFLAWLSAATSAVGIKASFTHAQNSRTSSNDAVVE